MTTLPTGSGAPRATARRVGAVAGTLSALAGFALILYDISTHVYLGGSDRATAILEGQAMGSGNVLLRGWILTHDSFWTIDAFFYALAVRIGGLRPGLLNLEPALAVAIAVVVGAFVASRGHRGGAAIAGAATVVALLALPTRAMASFLLGGPDHVSTAVLALVAFTGLRRGRFDWRWAVAVAALAFGMLGDLLMVAYGIVPILGAGVVSMLRKREWRSGIAAVTASAAASVASEFVSWLAGAMGAFKSVDGVSVAHFCPDAGEPETPAELRSGSRRLHIRLRRRAAPSRLAGRSRRRCSCDRRLLGGGIGEPVKRRCSRPPRDVRALDRGRALVARRRARHRDIRFGGDFRRAGRQRSSGCPLSRRDGRIRQRALWWLVAHAWQRLRPGRAARAVCLIGAGVSLCFAAGLGCTLAQPVPAQGATTLASWLEVHHLRNGVGGYWASSITTVESRGAVTVRPVWVDPDGRSAGT